MLVMSPCANKLSMFMLGKINSRSFPQMGVSAVLKRFDSSKNSREFPVSAGNIKTIKEDFAFFSLIERA